MPSKQAIDDFLAQKRIAFVGVSRDPKKFANHVYRALRQRGYQLFPVNPHADQVEGERCYPSISQLPEAVDGALVLVPRMAAVEVVRQCARSGIRRIWLHRGGGAGAVHPEAVEYCRQHGISVVDGACPMMFAEPVGFGHVCHRFVLQLTGSLQR